MLNISDELKTIYRNDVLPKVATLADKDLTAVFSGLNLTVAEDQFATDKGDLELTESICTEDQLKFGKCNASMIKFTLANVTDSIKGQEFSLTQKVNSTYDMPYGLFKVETCPKQDDLIFKDITAYDRMLKVDVDVSAWYNSLTFPMTLAVFRSSFLAYVGLEEDTSNNSLLYNNGMAVEKTLDNPAQLSGRTVIEAIEELNGDFGHINRYGKFTHIVLGEAYTDYPQDDYPSDDDYPEEEPYEQIESYMCVQKGIKFDEYTCKAIDKLVIRQEENDVGYTYGTGTNAYIIQGNFLVYGKSSAELATIAANAAKNIFNREYRPYTAELIGLPYVEVGDSVKYHTDDAVVGYVLSRTLKGIQALRDTYEAQGSEEQAEKVSGTSYEINQLKGQFAKQVKTVDEISTTMGNLEESTESQFKQTAEEIDLRVTKAGVIGAINLSSETAQIEATKINLTGYVTVSDLSGSGTTAINGSNITTGILDANKVNVVNLKADSIISGTLDADKVTIRNLSADDIVSGTLDATKVTVKNLNADNIKTGTLTGIAFVSTGIGGTTTIANGTIATEYIEMASGVDKLQIQTNKVEVIDDTGNSFMTAHNMSTTDVFCTTVNGGTPITTANYNQLGVAYPPNLTGASGLYNWGNAVVRVVNGLIVAVL